MKKQLFIASVLAIITLPARATSPQLATACGTLKVTKVMCITAPCYPLVRVRNAGTSDVAVVGPPASQEEAYETLLKKQGAEVCVYGFWQNSKLSAISVLDWAEAKSQQ